MKRIAAPMVGGVVTSFLLELFIYPSIYVLWKWHFEVKRQKQSSLELRRDQRGRRSHMTLAHLLVCCHVPPGGAPRRLRVARRAAPMVGGVATSYLRISRFGSGRPILCAGKCPFKV